MGQVKVYALIKQNNSSCTVCGHEVKDLPVKKMCNIAFRAEAIQAD